MAKLKESDVLRIAGIELNAMGVAGTLPMEELVGAEVSSKMTPIHDVSGELLFQRVPVVRGRDQVAFVDVAVHDVLGDPMLAVTTGLSWAPEAIAGEAREWARRRGLKVEDADEVRFVAYSYPKIAVQFLSRGRELAMLEWMTWEPVPRSEDHVQRKDRKPLEPGNFERWSIIEEMPPKLRRERRANFEQRVEALRGFRFDLDYLKVAPHAWIDLFKIKFVETDEIGYSNRSGDHSICYELRGQETNVWCVGASAQMLLDFYRYEYTQTRLAQELGLGTMANPNGLPYSQVAHVVTALETLTGKGLDVTMITNPGFNVFRDEIKQNRPLISFVPGHSRTVAGYTRNLIAPINQQPYQGLLVYDPWPPNAGVITKWENFATQTYQYAYSAEVQVIP